MWAPVRLDKEGLARLEIFRNSSTCDNLIREQIHNDPLEGGTMTEENVRREEFRVRGEALVEKVKELVHEGNIRGILIMDNDGKTLLDIPLTLGVLGALVAPQLAALGALAALVSDATIVVEIVE